jgi:hypothetical protein
MNNFSLDESPSKRPDKIKPTQIKYDTPSLKELSDIEISSVDYNCNLNSIYALETNVVEL